MPSLTTTTCPVCASRRVSASCTLHDYYCGLEGDFELWRCKDCHAGFLNPMLSPDQLGSYYPASYYSFAKQDGATRRGLLRRLISRPLFMVNALLDRLNKGNAWGRYLCRNRCGEFLDIGCGAGGYLRFLKSRNPAMIFHGCDPYMSEDAVEALTAEGVAAYPKALSECSFPDEFFDVVTINHVLEHVGEPHALMREVRRILKPAGLLVIGVPNVESLPVKLFRGRWCGWDAPRHLVDYGPHSLNLLLERHGLEIRRLRFIGNGGHFLDSLRYALYGQRQREGLLAKEPLSQFLLLAFNPLVFLMNAFRQGDSIEVCAMKRCEASVGEETKP